MPVTKLTRKYQTTVPRPVREILHLREGDSVVWEIEDGEVVLKKALPLDLEYAAGLEQTLSEWSSEYDEEAYRDL